MTSASWGFQEGDETVIAGMLRSWAHTKGKDVSHGIVVLMVGRDQTGITYFGPGLMTDEALINVMWGVVDAIRDAAMNAGVE